jgi:hypothetical protein
VTVYARNVVRTSATIALDKSMDHLLSNAADVLLIARANVLVALHPAYVRDIRLDNFSLSAHQRMLSRSHRFTKTVRDKPRSLERDTERAMQLVCSKRQPKNSWLV